MGKKRAEAVTAKQVRRAKRAMKAVPKDTKLKSPTTAFFLYLTSNRKMLEAKAKSTKIPAVAKTAGAMWKQLSDKDKKPYVDKATKAKADQDAYLKSAAGVKVLEKYKEALKPMKEKLVKLTRKPVKAKAKPKKKKAKAKPKKAKAKAKPKKAKTLAKPKKAKAKPAKAKATKAKAKKLTQIPSFGIGIPIALLIGFLVSTRFSICFSRRGASAMSTEPLLS